MAKTYACPKCSAKLSISAAQKGKNCRCPKCGAGFVVGKAASLDGIDELFEPSTPPALPVATPPSVAERAASTPRTTGPAKVQIVAINLRFWNVVWLVLLFWFATWAAFAILAFVAFAFLAAAGVAIDLTGVFSPK